MDPNDQEILADFGDILPYPCETHGRRTLLMKNLHIYQMMNTLSAKALMLPLTGIPEPLEDMHEINREVQLIECQIQ